MSREEAVDAYAAGRIPRRAVIRHLIAAGVTAAAAVTYADLLSPDRSDAVVQQAVQQDLYGGGLFDPSGSSRNLLAAGAVSSAADVAAAQAEQSTSASAASPVEADPRLAG